MKRLTILPILLILAGLSFGQVYTVPARQITEGRCEFCGAKIQELSDTRVSNYITVDPGMSMVWDPYGQMFPIPDSLRKRSYHFERSYSLCPNCWEKYHKELDQMYVRVFYQWFKRHERGFRTEWAKNNRLLRKERVDAKMEAVKEEKKWDPEYPIPDDARDPEEEKPSWGGMYLKGSIFFCDSIGFIGDTVKMDSVIR